MLLLNGDNRQTIKTIEQAKSTLQYPFAPFFFYFISSVIYTLYGFVISNALMGGTALLGAVMGSYYVFVYYTHAGDKTQPTRMLTYSFVFIVLLSLAVSHSPDQSPLLIGVPGNILSVLTSASPLLQVKTILRLKDASSLPFGMSVMNVVAGGVWMVYGFMLGDPLVILPNMFAFSMGVIQVSLIALYPGAAAAKAGKKNSALASPAPPLPQASPRALAAARARAKAAHEKA